MAHYLVTYRFKPFMTKNEGAAMMEVYGSIGPAPGERAHYVWVDGTGGTITGEIDDIGLLYRNLLNYGDWMEFDLKLVLPIDTAIPQVADYLS